MSKNLLQQNDKPAPESPAGRFAGTPSFPLTPQPSGAPVVDDSSIQPRGGGDRKRPGFGKKGLAGLIVMVLVMGYLMAIGTSNSLMVQSEAIAEGSRQSYKRAHFAALAGIQFVIGRLRADPVDPWTTAARLFFTFDAGCVVANHHYRRWTNTSINYSGKSQVKGKQAFYTDHAFAINTDEDPASCKFTVCTYPGVTADTDYWVKSQGSYKDPAKNIFKAQVWAFLEIDNSLRNVTLKKWGQMSVQPLEAVVAGSLVNDFWDQQDVFY